MIPACHLAVTRRFARGNEYKLSVEPSKWQQVTPLIAVWGEVKNLVAQMQI